MYTQVLEENAQYIQMLCARLRELQNEDHGFKGYHCYDRESGVWTTAEIVHLIRKVPRKTDTHWLENAISFLEHTQNLDGGWGFRPNGKSITDITAWTCLALSHYGYTAVIERGLEFVLAARQNEGEQQEAGWGLTTYEQDRVYSTWIASYCCSRILTTCHGSIPESLATALANAVLEAKDWLLSVRNPDGGWGPTAGEHTKLTSTAAALLTLFMQGENPILFTDAYELLRSKLQDGLWELEREIVVTREGYELPQEWFTSAMCFRVLIFFGEMGVAPIDEVYRIYRSLLTLIEGDGSVRPARGASCDLIWAIPYMVEVLDKFNAFITSKRSEFSAFLEVQHRRAIQKKRDDIDHLVYQRFPYPVSQVFFEYQHELDFHRKFQLVQQLYEISVKYACIVCLSGYLAARESLPKVNEFIESRLRRPSLGDWTSALMSLLQLSEGAGRLLFPQTASHILSKQPNFLEPGEQKPNLQQVLSRIVTMRNSTSGHGALRSLYEYKTMSEAEQGPLYSFVHRMSFLAAYNSFLVLAADYDEFGEGDRYKIRIFNGLAIHDDDLETANRLSEGQREKMIRYIYFHNPQSGVIVNLYPFLSYMYCAECKHERFFIYNGLKEGDRVAYLSYECGHVNLCDNMSHFSKRLASSGVTW